jgi:hypothetical protein
MRLCWILLFFTISCEEKNNKIQSARVSPQYEISSFSIFNQSYKDDFVYKNDDYLHSKHKYILDSDKVNNWFSFVLDSELLKDNEEYKSFSTLELIPKTIIIETKNKTKFVVEGYKNKSQGLVNIKTYRNNKFISGNSFYVSEENYNKLIISTKDLRIQSIALDHNNEVFYNLNDNKIRIKEGDSLKIYNILKNLKIDDYIYNGFVDRNVLNKYKFNHRVNNNIVGDIIFLSPTKKELKISFAKPKPRVNLTYVYVHQRNEIYKVNIKEWLNLTKILQKYR